MSVTDSRFKDKHFQLLDSSRIVVWINVELTSERNRQWILGICYEHDTAPFSQS